MRILMVRENDAGAGIPYVTRTVMAPSPERDRLELISETKPPADGVVADIDSRLDSGVAVLRDSGRLRHEDDELDSALAHKIVDAVFRHELTCENAMRAWPSSERIDRDFGE